MRWFHTGHGHSREWSNKAPGEGPPPWAPHPAVTPEDIEADIGRELAGMEQFCQGFPHGFWIGRELLFLLVDLPLKPEENS